MTRPLPPLLPWLGLAGLIPFAGGAVLAWAAPDPALRLLALQALAAYGAVILSFLGAVHWGLALAAPAEGTASQATPARLVLGVIPSLVGWVALLLPPVAGLVLLGLAIVMVAAAETLAARSGLLPPAYLRLRWGLSLGAAASLIAGAAVA